MECPFLRDLVELMITGVYCVPVQHLEVYL
jgi:hypothetical protein